MKNKIEASNIQKHKIMNMPLKIAGHPYKVINPGDSLRTIIGIPTQPQRNTALKIKASSTVVPE